LHELARRDQDVLHARLKRDRNGMRFARLRDNASVNDYFFGDRFSFHFCNLHFRDWTSGLLLFPNAESLRDPDERSDNDKHNRRDDNSFLVHLAFNAAFDGR
jgi:hypothetical protein